MTQVRSILVCDDIRHEQSGKEILVGVYSGGINFVGSSPGRLLQLCMRVEIDLTESEKQRRFLLEFFAPSQAKILSTQMHISANQTGRGVVHFMNQGVVFYEEGKYTIKATVEGTDSYVDEIAVEFHPLPEQL